MWKLKILTVCLCFALPISAVDARSLTVNRDLIGGAAVQDGFPNVFRPIGNLFKKLFGRNRRLTETGYANVTGLFLSRREVSADCAGKKAVCLEDKRIGVYAEGTDPENDPLIFQYNVSGGKIIGQGDKVVWDLTGEKPGVYTVTAGVDDGCGVCGYTQTRTVTVIE